MRKEKLLEQLKSIKAPEPDEETVLRSEEELIKKVRISFSQIVQERRVIRMKNRTRVVFATVAVVIAAVISSAVIVPTIKVAQAKQVAQNVIAKEMHATVNGKDMVVNGNTVSAVAFCGETIMGDAGETKTTFTIKEVIVDTETHEIIKSSPAEPTSLTEEERNRAIEIFRSSPEVKKFPISVSLPPNENTSNNEGEVKKFTSFVTRPPNENTSNNEGNYVDLSKATIVSLKGYAFPDRKEKYAVGEVQLPEGQLPEGYVGVGDFVVDLQKGEIVSLGYSQYSQSSRPLKGAGTYGCGTSSYSQYSQP